jgi:hypothetical protein
MLPSYPSLSLPSSLSLLTNILYAFLMFHLCRKAETAYMKFVHDITEDVLARGIYSDRGLQQLFQRHVANNEGQLNLVGGG